MERPQSPRELSFASSTLARRIVRSAALDGSANGAALFEAAQEYVRSPAGVWGDLPLYWSRLRIGAVLRRRRGEQAAAAFEDASRNLATPSTRSTHSTRSKPSGAAARVLITGFDPYRLRADDEASFENSNPSGAAVLALVGANLETVRGPVPVDGAVFPVRFADFDDGIFERFLDDRLSDAEFLFTISMGGGDFHLDRFLANVRRGTDNAGVAKFDEPIRDDGPAFTEHTLSPRVLAAMQAVGAVEGAFRVCDHRMVQTRERGEFAAERLDDVQDATPVNGSGGAYLSNEIAYRAATYVRSRGLAVQTAHIHTPPTRGNDPERRSRIVEQVRRMMEAALRVSDA